ncbi:hypothetical protein D9M68_579160 [compost metagenome]
MIAPLGLFDHVADQLEVEQRFSALEFDLDRRVGRAEDKIQRLVGHLRGHVEGAFAFHLPGDLAVGAAVVAAQGDDEDVQVGETGQPRVAGAQLECEQLQRYLLVRLADKLLGAQAGVQRVAAVQRLVDQPGQVLGRQQQVLADQVGQQVLGGIEPVELEGQQLIRGLRPVGRQRLEFTHINPIRCWKTRCPGSDCAPARFPPSA